MCVWLPDCGLQQVGGIVKKTDTLIFSEKQWGLKQKGMPNRFRSSLKLNYKTDSL